MLMRFSSCRGVILRAILQRTCKLSGLLELLHGHVEAKAVNVQVSAGGR
jgi:hypothetical protein